MFPLRHRGYIHADRPSTVDEGAVEDRVPVEVVRAFQHCSFPGNLARGRSLLPSLCRLAAPRPVRKNYNMLGRHEGRESFEIRLDPCARFVIASKEWGGWRESVAMWVR